MSAYERRRGAPGGATVADAALDEALEHIGLLSARLRAVLALHHPRSALLGPRRCAGCRHRWPCATVQRGSRVNRHPATVHRWPTTKSSPTG